MGYATDDAWTVETVTIRPTMAADHTIRHVSLEKAATRTARLTHN